MQSGIGDCSRARRFGIPVVQHLPGVGQNFQDHPRIDCVWEYRRPLPPRNNGREATYVLEELIRALDSPDLQICHRRVPVVQRRERRADSACPTRVDHARRSWCGPRAAATVRLTGPDPGDPVVIKANMLVPPRRPEGGGRGRGTVP